MNKWKNFFLLVSTSILITGCGETVSDERDSSSNETIREESTTTEEDSAEEKEKTEVSFFGVGDNLIHSQIIEDANMGEGTYNFKPVYENFSENIEQADISYINQETPLAGDNREFSGYPIFNTPSDMAGNLVDLGFDLVNGANNHSLDHGTDGLMNNLEYWDKYEKQNEVVYTGTFRNQEERDEIPVIERNGLTFSFLAYTDKTNGLTPEEPYYLNQFDPELIKKDVERAQEVSDFVIVSTHWGEEHALEPNQRQKEYAELFADEGVDVVIGTHSHTIQPVEWVTGDSGNKTLVAYSLGNFIGSTVSDINLLGGNINFDFVEKNGEHSIEDVQWEPTLIHYEEAVPGSIASRTNFSVHYLDEYTTEMAADHALNNHEGNTTDPEYFQGIAEEVVEEKFRN